MAEPLLLIDSATAFDLLTIEECTSAVEAAFAAHARGSALMPGLLHVEANGGEFHIKAGGLRGERTYMVCKVNGGFFANQEKYKLPNIVGVIVLCDGSTGVPLAVMESGHITRMRTAAATTIAAKYLARPDSRVVTICGAGAQGEMHLRALSKSFPITRAHIWSRSGAESFATRLSRDLGLEVHAARELRSAARASDIVVTCTAARRWFLGTEDVAPGSLVAAVGGDSPEKQEIQPDLLAQNSVVPDLLSQSVDVGELHHAVSAGLMNPAQIRGELGAIIIGLAPKRMNADEIIVFDSTGTALQDAAAAAMLYEKAVANNRGARMAFWSWQSV